MRITLAELPTWRIEEETDTVLLTKFKLNRLIFIKCLSGASINCGFYIYTIQDLKRGIFWDGKCPHCENRLPENFQLLLRLI